MAVPTKIQHPLLRRPGMSQRKRVADAFALKSDYAPIDGRSLVDLLDYLQRYARQVVFPEPKVDADGAAYLQTGNWVSFFEKSLPFQLARFAKKDFRQLEGDLAQIVKGVTQQPDPATLSLLTDFCFFELICPLDDLQQRVFEYEFELGPHLKNTMGTPFRGALQRYIHLSNSYTHLSKTANTYFRVEKRNFTRFANDPWNIDDVFGRDSSVTNVPGGTVGAIGWLRDEIARTASQMLRVLRPLADSLPDYLEGSLQALQRRHEPHLGLLFVFLRLFKFFQGDLNKLTQEHLDFFYREVLRLKPREAVPDKAHLVFELAKSLKSYSIAKNTDFLDGKDGKNADIIFRLDDEVTIDSAQVKELKTLFLDPGESHGQKNSSPTVEGIYAAPKAASADGKGEPFREGQSKNWPTLGAKKGKFIAPGKDEPESLPFGRMGFVLASPVLWLNEGKRNVTITLECDAGDNEAIFSECFRDNFSRQEKFYKISEQTIFKLENLFSLRARAYLQAKLDAKSVLEEKDINPQTNVDLRQEGIFSAEELNYLRYFFAEPANQASHELRELPFASLSRHFNMLRLHQDPYPIGFDIDGFFAAKDLITCEPFLHGDDLIKIVTDRLDTDVQSNDWFTVEFSGEKGWFQAKPKFKPEPKLPVNSYDIPSLSAVVTAKLDKGKKTVTITIEAQLLPDEPKVAFYDEEAIKEHFELERPFPMVKIELNPKIQLACKAEPEARVCCLKVPGNPDPEPTALYHFFRHLKVNRADIQVTVCGMRNLIVQNEESLQDVNRPILPFGTRPKLGDTFYIGNKELFGKNWQEFSLYTEWKNKPVDFKDYYKDYTLKSGEIDNNSFKFKSAILEGRKWKARIKPATALRIFASVPKEDTCCRRSLLNGPAYYREFTRTKFDQLAYTPKSLTPDGLSPLNVNSADYFFRMTLEGKSFQHDGYPFVLANKLFDLSKIVGPISIDAVSKLANSAAALKDRITRKINEEVSPACDDLATTVAGNAADVTDLLNDVTAVLTAIMTDVSHGNLPTLGNLQTALVRLKQKFEDLADNNDELLSEINKIQEMLSHGSSTDGDDHVGVEQLVSRLGDNLAAIQKLLKDVDKAGLPNEPYTPTIKTIEMDYHAIADKSDIDLIHLYPFENSSKTEELGLGPTLFPTFTDEGTLFIGLGNATPGANLQLLFQLAEATADSESPRADVRWHYLTGNRWQPLRPGFEIVSDNTDHLTRSGIIKIALPRDISNVGNTLMPPPPPDEGPPLHWLKVSAPKFTAAVAEVFGVHAQAARAAYQAGPNSDLARMDKPLAPLQIGKPLNPDFRIKKVEQPYESFDGRVAEAGEHFNVRVSEHLRHKGRSVDLFDCEHLVLEAFPMLFKCKCINHTQGLSAHDYRRDLEVAPGFVTVAVVPDLRQLKPGEELEPTCPVSLLTDVKTFLQKRLSPFARLRVMNPRYEKIHVEIKVRLQRGRDENYYAAQLKTDLLHFLAPWYLGDSDKISFGQAVKYSDVVTFVENLEYIDFISNLKLNDSAQNEIVPLTARSILTGGKICIELDRPQCRAELGPVEAPPDAAPSAPTSIETKTVEVSS